MPDDGVLLRLAMRFAPSSVTVVTAAVGGVVRGITVGSLASVSIEPPLVSFNVGVESTMHEVIAEARHFVVHLLADTQASLATTFAEPDRSGPQQFAAVAHAPNEYAVPVLAEAPAVLHCAAHAVHPAGDHCLVLGRVVRAEARAAFEPLVHWNRSYHRLGARLPDRVWPF